MLSTSQTYLVKFDTNEFSQRQLAFLGKVAYGFLSPLHDQCKTKNVTEDPHFVAVVCYKKPITNKGCRESLSDIRYKIASIRQANDLQTGTVRACHIKGKLGRDSYYDHSQLQWFGKKGKQPDYRLWFPYRVYSKSGLKNYRDWTDKCLKVLPKPTDWKQNPYYSSQEYPAWNEYLIADLEKKDPVKSILAKKHAPGYKKKREAAREKAEQTRKNNMLKAGQEYGKSLQDFVNKHSAGLSDKYVELALVLQKLTALNHVAKTLADSNNWGSTAWLSKKLHEKYSTDGIYKLKNQVQQILFHYFRDVTKVRAYVPEDADKIWVNFCEEHNWERREFGEPPMEFFYSDPLEFVECPHCSISVSEFYYACYDFSVELNDDLTFDYHCPYPVGKTYFGPILKMKRVDQMPNESSPFLFGHESSTTEDEYAISQDLMKDIKDWANQYDLSGFDQYAVNEHGPYQAWIKKLKAEAERQAELERQRELRRQQRATKASQYLSEYPGAREEFIDLAVKKVYDHFGNDRDMKSKKVDHIVRPLLGSWLKDQFSNDEDLRRGLYQFLKPSKVRPEIRSRVAELRKQGNNN